MDNSTLPRGPGLFEITRANGERAVTNVRRLAGAERAPGSVLIAIAAWLLALIGAGALYVSFTAQQRVRLRRPPPGRGQHHRGAAARRADDRVHAAGARPVPGREVQPDRAGADPGLRRGVGLHERLGRRHRLAAQRRRLRGRADRARRGGRPGRRRDPPSRPGRRRGLGLDGHGPRRGGRCAAVGSWSRCTRCGSSWRPVDRYRAAADGARRGAAAGDSRRRSGGPGDRPAADQEGGAPGAVPGAPGLREPGLGGQGGGRAGAAGRPAGRVRPGPTCTPSSRAGRHERDADPGRHRRPGRRRGVRALHGVLRRTGSAACAGGSGCACTRARGSPRSPSWCSAGRATRRCTTAAGPARGCGCATGCGPAPPTTRSASAAASGSAGCYARLEDQVLIMAAPRTGKSGMVADRILDHPGPVLATSTRADLYESTAGAAGAARPGPRLQPAGRRRRAVHAASGTCSARARDLVMARRMAAWLKVPGIGGDLQWFQAKGDVALTGPAVGRGGDRPHDPGRLRVGAAARPRDVPGDPGRAPRAAPGRCSRSPSGCSRRTGRRAASATRST